MHLKHLFLAVFLFFFFCSAKEKQPPNFVFILIDDLGWADIKCNYPATFYDTPNIGKLAQNGVRFTHAYAANPVCSPTRAALITGKHPNRIGITDWIPGVDPQDKPLLGPDDLHQLPLGEITIAEKLKEKGYNTCFIGKWHLGGEGFLPENQGFDINIGGHHRGSPPGGYYSPYKNPKLRDGPEGEYLTNRLTAESIRFIQNNKENPFFLYLAFYTVHTPIQAAKDHFEKYRKKREKMDFNEIPYKKEGDGWTRLVQENPDYASMVAAMDENVGRISEFLQKEGLNENTWIIFTSDNGGLSTRHSKNAPTSNGPLRAGKGWCYEGGIRVPLIISGPEIASPGTVSEQPVISMDYFTTILHAAGIEHELNDGENLLPLLRGEKNINRDVLFWHYPHYHGSTWKPGSALRSGDWKLVVHYEDKRYELFNLKTDPGEKTDLSEMNPDKLEELKSLLDKKLSETGAKLPKPNPDYDPGN
ncbi:MAG: sulfatase [Prolixibacteraceae bacterium]